jgi:hypothetical protein
MLLDVDYKCVGKIPKELITNLLNSINESDWFDDDYRQNMSGMQDCNSIPIRHTLVSIFGYGLESIRQIEKRKLFYKFFPHIEPILNELKKYYEFRQYTCFLSRLKPSGVIEMHPDSGHFLELCHRVHVPLKSNSKIRYIIENNSYYWEPGKIYEFDNTREHGVINESEEYRIHLVFNLYNLSDEELETGKLSEKHESLLIK